MQAGSNQAITEATTPEQLADTASQAIARADDLATLEALRVEYLGKKGAISTLNRGLKDLAPEERPAFGQRVQQALGQVQEAMDARQATLNAAQLDERLQTETIDVSMPGTPPTVEKAGTRHPLTIVMDDIARLFEGMGFSVLPDSFCAEVETERYNFEALNFPADHPARDMQDTFYVDAGDGVLLRSQTSNAQIRFLEYLVAKKHDFIASPVQVLAPGRVYRNEAINSRKSVTFHQVEGLAVGPNIKFSDLKGVLHEFVRLFFEGERATRFRPSYFPFTEPSAEVDVECIFCAGNGCRTCSQVGWLEVLGCGMVDPNVFKAVDIDPGQVTGFAFGLGVERLTMLRYGVDDIRHFSTNDVRFLSQFTGVLS